mmetsp:Transcript_19406/g.23128  ORF Transcript_19406/g.23128 Transcript_19406/m.23128 type:complete len:181 (+) Transcript_19406:176-718(+)|eukprot:CAMPEP_0198258900 /NCGR_PEP_ID=MMETSP1447-20131203/8215_1 /TAXON_ID=420782 /ORGANISM="Chaetoceros dichaeta, Strain CCMP1751" /LENGTH=180 /DNA_ID=CAMNT_0043946145 /DNA_START=194 /DNA_END=736 /DNA_ORIENTATION=+
MGKGIDATSLAGKDMIEGNNQENNEGTTKNNKARVSFDNISVREYSRCMGNNPATTHGPSISIDWAYEEVGTFSLEDYEANRLPRRQTSQLIIPSRVREKIILEHTNVTKKQINNSVSNIQAARHKRQTTFAMQQFEEFHIIAQSLRRKIRRLNSGISKKRESELLWENAKRVNETSTTP